MAESYINYDKEPLEIWEDPSFSVYDPWTAQVLGVFSTHEAATTFIKAVQRKAKKAALKADRWPKK